MRTGPPTNTNPAPPRARWAATAMAAALVAVISALALANSLYHQQSSTYAQESPPLVNTLCVGHPYHDTPIQVTANREGSPPTLLSYLITRDTNPPGAKGLSLFRIEDGEPPVPGPQPHTGTPTSPKRSQGTNSATTSWRTPSTGTRSPGCPPLGSKTTNGSSAAPAQ